MMPLIDVVAVERDATCGAALEVAAARSHARIPVYHERVDRIVGVLDTLELLGVAQDEPIDPFVKPVPYVPPGKSIQDLLVAMRKEGAQMIVVVDEFGGAEGIVSIEDILEEVVEDIQDEYDAQEPLTQWIRRLDDNTCLVSARIDLDDLAEELGIELPKGRYASLAGFLLDKSGSIPRVGSVIEYQGIRFAVHRATPQVIQEVKVTR
jgi:putative hemolysin